MRARDIVGRTIVRVEQVPARTNAGQTVYHVHALHLDNGARVLFDTADMEDEGPAIVARVVRHGPRD